jgi:acetyltransferase
VRFGQLVIDQRWIKEIDINPLFASSDELVALDARVVLLVLRYRKANCRSWRYGRIPPSTSKPSPLKTAWTVTLRPIRPEDEPKMVKFHETLSERSVYLRYFRAFQLDQRVEHERLTRICFVDYDRDMAIVVTHKNPKSDEEEIIAAGRLTKERTGDEAEFAILVSDRYQSQGVGTAMLVHLLEIGRQEGVKRVVAYLLAENRGMRAICLKLGFRLEREAELFKAIIDLE